MLSVKLRKKSTATVAEATLEKCDLFDEERQPTGETIVVGSLIPKDRYVQKVMVFIVNSSGHYLIQKRTKNNLYDIPGGYLKSGQTSLQDVVTKIQEELGVEIDPKDLTLFYSGRSDENQCFFDDYFLRADIPLSKLKFRKDEVQFATWFMRNEVKGLFKRGRIMSDYYKEYLRLQSWLKEQKIVQKLVRKNQKKVIKERRKREKDEQRINNN